MGLTADQTGAFVEEFTVEPTAPGPLDGLTFAVKDIIDVAGKVTGCGNPTWAATHPPAAGNAVCVDQLLAAGAKVIGKTVTDELAFSLLGKNHFFGTPVNAAAPERVPGGSSSGSASAVAAGLCDFALGSDTGGSVRFPGSNCGLFGIRPTLGLGSLAGMMPLSATFDTVGVFAGDVDVFVKAAGALYGIEVPDDSQVREVHFIAEGFDTADDDVREALLEAVERVKAVFPVNAVRSITEFVGPTTEPGLLDFSNIYRTVMPAEAWSSLGSWIKANSPEFGPAMTQTMAMAESVDRVKLSEMIRARERYAEKLSRTLGPGDVLCMPTSPTLAPRVTDEIRRDAGQGGYYARSLGFTGLAGVGRLPQVTLPLGDAGGVPIGLSLIGGRDSDWRLLGATRRIIEG